MGIDPWLQKSLRKNVDEANIILAENALLNSPHITIEVVLLPS
jgi:hypothetical protein